MAAPTDIVMSFDPGGTTGYAILNLVRRGHVRSSSYDFESTWKGGQLGPDRHHKALWNLLTQTNPDFVVCEQFNYQIRRNQEVDQPGIQLISRNYIGVIELYCELTKKPLAMQSPSIMQNFWVKDTALKTLELHTKGQGHRNDATRHGLYFAVTKMRRKDLLTPLRKVPT
jgi:hypothetical protein